MNRVTMITGTRKGIGRELALYYLEKGHMVAGCSRKESSINHENYRHYTLNVSDEKASVAMVRSTKKEFGRIDNLINNAGTASMNHILTTPLSTVESLIDTNLKGTFLFTREAAKIMSRQRYGRIINFTTVASAISLEGEAVYAASKAAVESLTKTSAKELGEMGITVNGIGPTPVETDLIKNVPKEKIDELLKMQAVKRFGTFDDIKNVTDFFLAPENGFVTGQIIYLGGIHS